MCNLCRYVRFSHAWSPIGIVCERKVREFRKFKSIRKCFFVLLSWPECLYIRLPEPQSFLTNYDKEGNSRTFLPWMIPVIWYFVCLQLC